MYSELKRCKTIKEIYDVLGTEWFNKVSYFLLSVWVFLPVVYAVIHVFAYYRYPVNLLRSNMGMFIIKDIYEVFGVITLVFALFYILGLAIQKSKPKKIWICSLAFMLLWSIVCTLLSSDPAFRFRGSLYRYDGLMSYFIYASVFICGCILNNDCKEKVFTEFVWVADLMSVIVLLQYYKNTWINSVFLNYRAGIFQQFNHMGYYLCMSVLICGGLIMYSEKQKIIFLFSYALQIYALIVNDTFGGYLGVFCGLVFMYMCYLFSGRKININSIIPAGLFLLVSSSRFKTVSTNVSTLTNDVQDVVTDINSAQHAGTGRMTLWLRAFELIPHHLIFGYGPEGLRNNPDWTLWVDRPDNEFLAYLLFIGVPGTLAYCFSLLSCRINRFINIKTLNKTVLIAAAALIGYVVSGCFGNTMFYTTPYFWMLFGMISNN